MSKAKRKKVQIKITDAFVKLLKDKLYSDISITELVKKANVSRSSFYRFYNSIDDVIDEVICDFLNQFRIDFLINVKEKNEDQIKKNIARYLELIKEDKEEIFNCLPENTQMIVTRLGLKSLKERTIKTDTIKEKYYRHARFLNFLIIIKIWKDSNFDESIEDLSDFIYSVIL